MTDVAPTRLDDRYALESGRVLMSGRQALVRLLLEQKRLDRSRGLNTAGFVSGYRGSPLGGFDTELWKARRFLEQNDILFQPGLNEDIAATAVWGTQQVGFLPDRKVDGVFALWYGKGPGVDRSGDVFRHANMQGVEPNGGVVLVFGDDHAGKSSSVAHQSDHALAAHDIPILYPADVGEVLDFGLAALALSRASGLVVGLKVVNETAEATAVVDLDPSRWRYPTPDALPADDLHIRKEFLAVLEQNRRLVRRKLPQARAFVRAAGLDRIAFGSPRPRLLVVTAGKTWPDVLGALQALGVTDARARELGLGVLKLGMVSPIEPTVLAEACAVAEEVLVVEERRALIEPQIAALLINGERRIRLAGKSSPEGAALLPADDPLDPLTVASALAARLEACFPSLSGQLPRLGARVRPASSRAGSDRPPLARRPAFCAGCPHNTSTQVPEGSFGMAGIGCHGMVMFHPERNPLPVTQMGGEGANWLGLAPFTATPHVFQNLGDGTYNHSGSLAVRAAVQAGVNITYKVLFNDAVAMTGGQPVEGGLTVAQIVRQMRAEGVAEVVVVSEQPDRFSASEALPAGTPVHHRDELESVQRRLRETAGVTVLVYDQTCAAEKRRRRKRGLLPDPDRRLFINPLVCEGCGDCSVQSNCLALQPLATELGEKREIDQSACNKDFSCLKGFCPSFVTLEGAKPRRKRAGADAAPRPLPDEPEIVAPTAPRNILIAGVGGGGVVTIGAVLGMAAKIDGLEASLFDMTGLSQKGGAVYSHVRLAPPESGRLPVRIGPHEADVLLACDAVAGSQPEALAAIDPTRTTLIVNTDVAATADFHRRPAFRQEADGIVEHLRGVAPERFSGIAATSLALAEFGDAIAANMMTLGFAWQRGLVPLSRQAIEQAIELNAVAVPLNLGAFAYGRTLALAGAAGPGGEPLSPTRSTAAEFEAFLARRVEDLEAYQDPDYAERYRSLVECASAAEAAISEELTAFRWAVARAAFRLMAYKDEYEVARLFSDGRFKAQLDSEFEGTRRIRFHLAPPLLSRPDPRTGRPRKITLPGWTGGLFAVLARLKGLRGTPFDPFGWTAERRLERRARDLYLAAAEDLCGSLTAENHAESVLQAEEPLSVRGFGPVKRPALQALVDKLGEAPSARPSATTLGA